MGIEAGLQEVKEEAENSSLIKGIITVLIKKRGTPLTREMFTTYSLRFMKNQTRKNKSWF